MHEAKLLPYTAYYWIFFLGMFSCVRFYSPWPKRKFFSLLWFHSGENLLKIDSRVFTKATSNEVISSVSVKSSALS